MFLEKFSLRRFVAPLVAPLVGACTILVSSSIAFARPNALPFRCLAEPGFQVMIHVDGAFARALNGWTQPTVGRLLKFQCYEAVGRDSGAEWAYIVYGNAHVWVNRSEIRLQDGIDMTQLPVLMSTAELIAPTPVSRVSVGVPTVSKAMQDRYKEAVKAGRDGTMVTVIGDCNSERPVFLGRMSAGVVNLGATPELTPVARLLASSWVRTSVATHGSFSSAMAFDSSWTDPKICMASEGPLACEMRLSNASVVIVALGTGDTFDWQSFDANYRRIIDYVLSKGAVPLLMTKADALESLQGGAPLDVINQTVRALGQIYGVPVIDFAAAARVLPNAGLADEHTTEGVSISPFHISELGMDARMMMTLQTLAQIVEVPKPMPTPRATRTVRIVRTVRTPVPTKKP
ncbi:MAG: SGNH/GDSL hydrolase family protein [Chloroflexi bacterium]|nr:SGNH/GDSL hydrolase family protein [Chloroflexota bacterium]